MNRPPVFIVLLGRRCSGKTTLAKNTLPLLKDLNARMLTSTTTRAPRREEPLPGEYEHVSPLSFEELKSGGAFAWTTTVGPVSYGTKKELLDRAACGGVWVSIITPEYMQKFHCEIRARNPNARIRFLYLFVSDEETLRKRLLGRDGTDGVHLDRHWPEMIARSGIRCQPVDGELPEEKIAELIAALIESVYYGYL